MPRKIMDKKRKKKNDVTTASLGLDDSILRLFPKTSPMGYSRPSRWTRPDSTKEISRPPKNPPLGCA